MNTRQVSMIDEVTWNTIVEILSVIDHSRRPNDPNTDALGRIHVILFGAWLWMILARLEGL